MSTPKRHSPMLRQIETELDDLANADDAASLQRYFKTGLGEYGEGDRFLGIRVPVLRNLARRHRSLDVDCCRQLLQSPYHEARLLALLILVRKYDRDDTEARAAIYELYLDHTSRINNWDLVDSSAPHIVGRHLEDRDRSVLLDLARSGSVWERRIAILSTLRFIRGHDFSDALRIADILLTDEHPLIQKAVGWMLREIGTRDRDTVEGFLRSRYEKMPRTMLRYAIERFPPPLRQQYLRGDEPRNRPGAREPTTNETTMTSQLDTPDGRRLVAALRAVCQRLPEVDEVIDGFGHTTFKVRKKSFLIAGMGERGEAISIKADPVTQESLVRHGPYYRTPYIGQHGWVSIADPLEHDWDEIEELIVDGFRRAAPKRLARLVGSMRGEPGRDPGYYL